MSDSDDVTLDSLGASGPAVGGSKGKGTKRRRSQASYKEPGSEDDEAFVEAPTAAKVRLRPCAAACRWPDHAAWCPLPLQKPRSKTPSKAASAAKKAAPAKKAASAKKKPVAGKKKAAAGKKKPAAKKAAEVKAGKVKELKPLEEIEAAMKAHKWWEEDELPDGVQWRTLEHTGVVFPDDYTAHGVKLTYGGEPVDLTPAQEELATFYAQMPLDGPQLGDA
ncbi:TOP1B, partial [Symbiodinium sp. KB8]